MSGESNINVLNDMKILNLTAKLYSHIKRDLKFFSEIKLYKKKLFYKFWV